ncbi:arginine deiminase family protein, partial [Micrococcus sp. SIMBA_144]
EYGDVMILNKDAILINVGIRTSIESVEALQGELFKAGFSEIGVIDLPRRPDTMHLDMNCTAVGGKLLIGKSDVNYLPLQVITAKGF